jgi:hypothetical protein
MRSESAKKAWRTIRAKKLLRIRAAKKAAKTRRGA